LNKFQQQNNANTALNTAFNTMESDEIPVTADVGVATALNLNAFDVLRQTPRVPSMTQKFYLL
jgi:hypothetical protein